MPSIIIRVLGEFYMNTEWELYFDLMLSAWQHPIYSMWRSYNYEYCRGVARIMTRNANRNVLMDMDME